MIAVNNIKINLQDESNVYAKEIRAGIKLIKLKYKFPLIFTFSKHLQRTVQIEMNHKIPGSNTISKTEMPAGKNIHFHETVASPHGEDEWTYYESTFGVGDKKEFYPSAEMLEKVIIIQETQIEKAFFFLFKSKNCEDSLDVNIRNSNKEKFFKLENPKFDAFVKLRNETPRIKVEALVMIENKELPEDKLRAIAITYGISNALDMEDNPESKGDKRYVVTEDELRVTLMSMIRNLYKSDKQVYDKFLENIVQEPVEKLKTKVIDENENSELVTMVKDLLNKNTIELKQTGAYKQWVYTKEVSDDELKGKKIFTCKKGCTELEDCIKNIAEYLPKNETMKENLMALTV